MTVTPISTGLYDETLAMLSDGSVNRHFDPYLDIDWDNLPMDADDPRWVLHPDVDPLGATAWYQAQPIKRQIEIGRWRTSNAIKVGAAFESILIRGMLQYIMKLPNGSPEFRYCMHEMTEECNHIQMFQELVNRIGADVPGPRKHFRILSPFIGVAGGYAYIILFMGILGGEEPIDHYQKAVIRQGDVMPPAVLRCMQIHIAEEARHISFANEFLKKHVAETNPVFRQISGVAFPLAMRWLAGEIMVPPREFAQKFNIPHSVIKQAFWQQPQSSKLLSGYFGEMRSLAEEMGLMNPVTRRIWNFLGVGGPTARYRGEPDRAPSLSAIA